jgi:hypothetical protein
MKQNDVHFINIVNRFRIVSQTNKEIHFMNNFYLKPPAMDNILPHLFYTNLKATAHNKIIYDKTPSETFEFLAKDIHFETRPFHFKLLMLPSHKIVYDKTPGETFKFLAKDIHFETCSSHFKLSMLPSHTSGFHHQLLL